MAPDFRERLTDALGALTPLRVNVPDAREAAVLIPIIGGAEPALLFTVRTDTVRSHKGQISFPGGSMDPGDASLRAAALRETEEEVGLDPSVVEVVGELDTFPTFISGYVVTPFVGWIGQTQQLHPNPAEVASVLEVPLVELREEIRLDAGFELRGRTYPTEAWVWRDHIIWGVTARILRQLLEVLARAGLAERPAGDGRWVFPPPK
ncbi:MAG: CoA pyrophosphatase [Actinomycetota bacterium]